MAVTPIPPLGLLLAPNTPLPLGAMVRPNTPFPPTTPAGGATVALLTAKRAELELDLDVANIPVPLSQFPETPVPPVGQLLAPNTPLAVGARVRPKTPQPPTTPAGGATVALLTAKMPELALDLVVANIPLPLSQFPETPVPPVGQLLAPNTPLALGTVVRPKMPLPPGVPAGHGVVAVLEAKIP